MKENDFNALVKKVLRSQGAIVHAYVACVYTAPGVPDCIVWHRSWCGWIELKGAMTKVGPRQYHEINQLNLRRPGTAVVVRRVSGGNTNDLMVSIDGGQPIPVHDLLSTLAKACQLVT